MTIYTGIFGDYDILKEPKVITPGWRYVCYTNMILKSKTWEIKRVGLLPGGPQRTARYYKIMFHRHITDEYSIYIDGSFLINCDLNEWWQRFQPPMTVIKHPIRNCVYQEARAVLRNKRKGVEKIFEQIRAYKKAGVPAHNGLIQSGLLMRQLTPETIALCENWYAEMQRYSARDQLSFAFISCKNPIHHVIKWDYQTGKEFLYKGHKK